MSQVFLDLAQAPEHFCKRESVVRAYYPAAVFECLKLANDTSTPGRIDMRRIKANPGKSRPSMHLNLLLKSVISLDWKSSQMSAH